MKRCILRLSILSILMLLSACSNEFTTPTTTHSTSNPDAEEVFRLYENPDVIQWEGLVYVAGVEWVEELELTPEDEIGRTTKQTNEADEFTDGAANLLPLGTPLYSAQERGGVLLVESNGEWVAYLALVEG